MSATIKRGYREAGGDIDVKVSGEYEEKFVEMLGSAKYEVKTDFWFAKTNNLCVEMFGKNGRPSGLSITESDFWVFQLIDRDGKTVAATIIVETERLKGIVERWKKARGKNWLVPCGDDDATLGAMIPIKLLMPGADWFFWEARDEEEA